MENKCNVYIDLLNNIICSDWSQFFPSVIATFIGFVLAILGMWIYDSIRKFFERKNLREDIRNELLRIQEVLKTIEKEDNIAKGNNSKILRINPLKCYIWDSAISTNRISLLNKLSCYSELLSIYDTINDFNQWQLLKSNKILEGIDVHAINIHLEELKEQLILQVADVSVKLRNKMFLKKMR